ncbi:ShlB/FhaC/HecB family hemolysin secretion/activation protein [Cupriavidus basilensis]|uniref:ShlB/FhaC/HecB family hemolysin secretion/activation protein n=1 Tax=Cupriavidus basilensis TaxID=68895 RepID=A0ABT6ALU1_9BURK|nr:ShlB/FhaC/HecB family hemolysin secretion/activation protein [Cupriavidus basilensis]MDF3833587.1 ShlB/FhaC/HecB family hemolysin secretion/activation protein [Cupriavidus basilensis]
MHDKKKDPSPCWRAVCLAVLGLGVQGTAMAQGAAAVEPPAPSVQPDAERRVDINEYIVRGNTVLDARSIERAVKPYLGPGRTIKDIEGARDALLAAYQAKGFQSVYVDLPEQQAHGGVVFLQVSETRVGRVRVVGAQYNSPLEVREQVPALAEGVVPDFNQAQTELTALNRGANRQVMPLVKQGAMAGTMDVDLKVDDSSPWRASVGLNNDYSADTSQLRATASLGHDNLWQLGHSASVSFFGAPQDLKQTQVWSGSYVAPIRGTNWGVEASGYVSDSNVATVGGTNVLGKGHSVGLKGTYTVPNTGAWWHAFSLGVDFKDNEEVTRLGSAGDTVPLKYAPITLGYSAFGQTEQGQYGLNLSLVAGTRSFLGYGSSAAQFDYKRFKASPSFMVLKADTNGSYNLPGNAQLGWRLAGQITDSPLVSNEQIAAGGMNSVRGYLAAETTGDYGVVGSVELRTPPLTFFSAVVENWRAYLFADGGQVRLRDPLPEQKSQFSLASVGLGTTFRLGQKITGRLDLGYPLKAGPRTGRGDPRVNFSVTASY